jgi:ATP-binding cassette subfamily C (CFTR/MRP) protein 1
MNKPTIYLVQLDDSGPTRPGAFDFTLLFEDSIFTIAPASLFLIAACVRTAFLHGSPAKVESTSSRQIKVSLLSAFVALEFALLLLWSVTPGVATKASVPAACLDFIAAGALFVLSSYEHTRSVAPSTLIGIYLLITIPLDIARVRTLFLLDETSQTKSIGTIFATSVTVKMGVLLSEAMEKRHILLARYRHLPPEATSGPYSRTVFWWINPLLWRGFSSVLEVGDLYTVDDSLSSTRLGEKFQEKWTLDKKTHKHSLLRVVCSALKWNLVTSGLPRFILIGLKFVQPFLIRRTIDYVSDRKDQPANIGRGLVGAYAIVYISLALLTASSTYLLNRFNVRIRGGIVSLIYQKTVDLSITALEEGAALTLMSTDVERITRSFRSLHDAWAAIIEVAIALYLLYAELGAGFVAPSICFACAALAVTVCTKLFPRYQKIWVEAIQARVSSTSAILGSMRSIKLLGISVTVNNLTQSLRVRENVVARKFRWLLIFQVVFQNITSIAAPVATFAVYVLQANSAGKPLEASTAFSILSILQLLEPPLMLLVQSLPSLVASIGCFTRIQTFLMSSSRQDHRLSLPDTTNLSRNDLAGSCGEEGIELADVGHQSNISEKTYLS